MTLDRRWVLAGALFALSMIAYGFFSQSPAGPNTTTRVFAAISLVHDGDATIDEFAHLTIDKAQFGDHYVTDKAPGMTIMALGPVAIVSVASDKDIKDMDYTFQDVEFRSFMQRSTRLSSWLSSGLLTALAVSVMYLLASRLLVSHTAGLVSAVAFGFATPMWGWATTFFGHAAAASLLFLAFAAIVTATEPNRSSRDRHIFAGLGGLCLGSAFVVEHTAALPGFIIGLFALYQLRDWTWVERGGALLWGAVGAAVALSMLIGYNLIAFGHPFQVGYQGVVGFEGMDEGVLGLTYPKINVIWEIVFGSYRGVLWVAPVLVITPIGFWLGWRFPQFRSLIVVCLLASLVTLLLNASYYYWHGGASTGPRHLTPALPFLTLFLGLAWREASGRLKRVFIVLLGSSVAVGMLSAATSMFAPSYHAYPLFEWTLARLLEMNVRIMPARALGIGPGWLLAPFVVMFVAALTALFVSARRWDAAGRVTTAPG